MPKKKENVNNTLAQENKEVKSEKKILLTPEELVRISKIKQEVDYLRNQLGTAVQDYEKTKTTILEQIEQRTDLYKNEIEFLNKKHGVVVEKINLETREIVTRPAETTPTPTVSPQSKNNVKTLPTK